MSRRVGRSSRAQQGPRFEVNVGDIPENSTFTFNVSIGSLVAEYTQKIDGLHQWLISNDFCDVRPLTSNDQDQGVARLNFVQAGNQREVSILIQRKDIYVHAFFASNRWWVTKDSGFSVRNSTMASFFSSYGSVVVDKVGPGTILNAFGHFSTNDHQLWRRSLLNLAFMFSEACRFQPVFDFILNAMTAAELQVNLNYFAEVDARTSYCPAYWDKISQCLQEFFNPLPGELAVWSLPLEIVAALSLPEITVADTHPDFLVQRQNQINECLNIIRIVKRRL